MLRAVPMTLWPAFRAARARERPRPEEAPVIRRVCFGVWEEVVVAMAGGCWVGCRGG